MMWIIWGLVLIQYQNSSWLDMFGGSRCWIHWILYEYCPVCNIDQTLMHRVLRWLEILCVLLVHGLRCTMSVMVSSSSTFHCTSCSVLWFTVGRDLFSCRYWWNMNTHQSGIRPQGYHCWYSSARHYHFKTHKQNAYLSILHRNTSPLQLHHTVHLPQDEMAHCVLSHVILALLLHEYIHVWVCPLHITTANIVSVADGTHVYMTFVT